MHEIKIDESVEFLCTTSNSLINVTIIKIITMEIATKTLTYLRINITNHTQDHYKML